MPKLTLYSVYSPRLKGLLKHPATVQRGDGLPMLFPYEETAEQASSCLIEPGPVVQVTLEWSLAEPMIADDDEPSERLVAEATENMIAEAAEPRRVGRLGLSAGKKSVHKPPVPRP